MKITFTVSFDAGSRRFNSCPKAYIICEGKNLTEIELERVGGNGHLFTIDTDKINYSEEEGPRDEMVPIPKEIFLEQDFYRE